MCLCICKGGIYIWIHEHIFPHKHTENLYLLNQYRGFFFFVRVDDNGGRSFFLSTFWQLGCLCVELHARVWIKSYCFLAVYWCCVLCHDCYLKGEDKFLFLWQLSCWGCEAGREPTILYFWGSAIINFPEKGRIGQSPNSSFPLPSFFCSTRGVVRIYKVTLLVLRVGNTNFAN